MCRFSPAAAGPVYREGTLSNASSFRMVVDDGGQNVVQLSSPDFSLFCSQQSEFGVYQYTVRPLFTTQSIPIVNGSFAFQRTLPANATTCTSADVSVTGTIGPSGVATGTLRATIPAQCPCAFSPNGSVLD